MDFEQQRQKNLFERVQRVEMLKGCIIANCKKVVYILETTPTDELCRWGNWSRNAELRNKMKEIRRDTVELGKEIL